MLSLDTTIVIRKHECEFVTTTTIEFGESLQYKLILKEILNVWKSVFPPNADLLRTQLFIVKMFRNAIKSKSILVKKSYFHNPINIYSDFRQFFRSYLCLKLREKLLQVKKIVFLFRKRPIVSFLQHIHVGVRWSNQVIRNVAVVG